MDGMLSQEEINALLNGMGGDDSDTSSESDALAGLESDTTEAAFGGSDAKETIKDYLTDMEIDALGEVSNISMGTAATTLSSLVNQKVNITTPEVSYSHWDDIASGYESPCVFLQIHYKEGLDGNNILILKELDVKIIADLMMGGDGTNTSDELGELHLSAICEAMNQMMGSASTSLSSLLNMKIDISPPTAKLINLTDNDGEIDYIVDFLKNGFVKNAFRMTIGDLVDSEIMQLFPVDFAKNLCKGFMGGETEEVTPTVKEEPVSQPTVSNEATVNIPEPQPQDNGMGMMGMPQNMMGMSQNMMGMPQNMMGMPQGMMGMPQNMMGMPQGMMGMPQGMMGMPQTPVAPMQEINVQPAQFQAFSNDISAVNQKENINLIMDVPLEVTVELGRTSKSIQDILEFAPGTIIELDKIAGEPIDVLVNGKYVAKGEVVVIEESFGVRVTEIIK